MMKSLLRASCGRGETSANLVESDGPDGGFVRTQDCHKVTAVPGSLSLHRTCHCCQQP